MLDPLSSAGCALPRGLLEHREHRDVVAEGVGPGVVGVGAEGAFEQHAALGEAVCGWAAPLFRAVLTAPC